MNETQAIVAGITLLSSLINNQVQLAQAKAAAANTTADEKAQLVAAIDSLHASNATLNTEWIAGRPNA